MPEDRGVKKSMGDASEDQAAESPFEDEDNHGFSPDVGHGSDEARQAGNRAFEGRETQAASRAEGPVEVDADAPPKNVGVSEGRRGEEMGGGGSDEAEPEDWTGVGRKGPKEDDMPNIPPGDQAG